VAVRAQAEVRPQGIDLRPAQPGVGPTGQVPPARAGQCPEQVGERRVTEGVRGEVLPQAGDEGLVGHPGVELAQHRGALGVGDPVEVE
jgi:hypothetical protein